MERYLNSQAYLFYIFTLTGILLGILFDVFRVSRKSFKTTDFITYIEDIFFWVIAGFILFYTIYKFNNGQIRSYVLLGLATGICVYVAVFSKVFIKINVKIILLLKKMILYPIKLIIKLLRMIFLKPISFIFINIRKSMSNIVVKFTKISHKIPKNVKKSHKKEGILKKV